ncbi:MAG: CIA30 family protein [Bacteroidota bacterium]
MTYFIDSCPEMLFAFLLLMLVPAPLEETGHAPAFADSLLLFEFEIGEARWEVVNDGVMGGRSRGQGEVGKGALRFTGTLVTQGGGFSSVRTDRRVDLSGYDGLELRVRGNGRPFEVEVSDGTRFRGLPVSRRGAFETSDEWAVVRVPFDVLGTSVFGRQVRVDRVDLSAVESFGFYILDGQDGPFELEVDWVRAYQNTEG